MIKELNRNLIQCLAPLDEKDLKVFDNAGLNYSEALQLCRRVINRHNAVIQLQIQEALNQLQSVNIQQLKDKLIIIYANQLQANY